MAEDTINKFVNRYNRDLKSILDILNTRVDMKVHSLLEYNTKETPESIAKSLDSISKYYKLLNTHLAYYYELIDRLKVSDSEEEKEFESLKEEIQNVLNELEEDTSKFLVKIK